MDKDKLARHTWLLEHTSRIGALFVFAIVIFSSVSEIAEPNRLVVYGTFGIFCTAVAIVCATTALVRITYPIPGRGMWHAYVYSFFVGGAAVEAVFSFMRAFGP